MKFKKWILVVTIALLSFNQVFCQIVILSGPEKGSYYRFADDIVTMIGAKHGMSLKNKATTGSGYNFKELVDPASPFKIAFIQSDYLNLMKAEDKLNNTNKTGSIKVMLQLAREEIQIVAKKSSGLNRIQDLENKKVAIGNEDQGSSATGRIIKERSKINWTTAYVGFDQLLKQLSDGVIDAGLVVGSAPINILDIDPQIMTDGISMLELNDFNGWARYYENDTVYRSDYKWLDKDIPTFSVRTMLIVNESKLTEPEKKAVAAIKAAIINDLDILKKNGHPKWKEVITPDGEEVVLEKNSVTPKPETSIAVKKADVVYRVQIYSRNYEKKDDRVTINDVNYKPYVYSHAGAYRYTIGEFPGLSSAVELQNVCRKSGYPEAFVAAFKDNARTSDPDLFR